MKYLDKYKIAFASLPEGVHDYEFLADGKLFESFDFVDISDAQIKVLVSVQKSANVISIGFNLDGTVQVACDRCLENFNLPISYEGNFFIRFGDDNTQDSDDCITLPFNETEINLSPYIYEFTSLCLPIKKVHPDDADGNPSCNEEMLAKLDEHAVNGNILDPRWNDLNKLIN